MDAPAYLRRLFTSLVDPKTLSSADNVVKVVRTTVASLAAVKAQFPHAKALVNASGLGAAQIMQDEDKSNQLIRGQTVLVELPAGVEPKTFIGINSYSSTVAKDACQEKAHSLTYIIPRARSGKVILGGTYEPGRNETNEDREQTMTILRNAVTLWPALIPPPTAAVDAETEPDGQGWQRVKVLKVNVGFRPGRSAGARVELAPRVSTAGADELGRQINVIHAYGLGGAGYQRSVGVALQVDKLLDRVLCTPRQISSNDTK